jgi:hypothetical protein
MCRVNVCVRERGGHEYVSRSVCTHYFSFLPFSLHAQTPEDVAPYLHKTNAVNFILGLIPALRSCHIGQAAFALQKLGIRDASVSCVSAPPCV